MNARPGKLVLAAMLALSAGVADVRAEEDEPGPPARGRTLFTLYCAACHGDEGRGDGPLASQLEVRPADLTGIARRNQGRFPASAVYDKIYGIGQLPGHRKNEMPLWGFEFQQTDLAANQQQEVQERIEQLVSFLETIQRDD